MMFHYVYVSIMFFFVKIRFSFEEFNSLIILSIFVFEVFKFDFHDIFTLNIKFNYRVVQIFKLLLLKLNQNEHSTIIRFDNAYDYIRN